MIEKPDIIEFIETQCNIELLTYQKELIRKIHDAGPDAKIIFPYRSGFSDYRHLTYMLKELFKGE